MNNNTGSSKKPQDLTASLVSLAMLKVNSDLLGRDYMEYLRPFVEHVLNQVPSDYITDNAVRSKLEQEFGLRLPVQVVQHVLRRMKKSGFFTKDDGVYRLCKALPTSAISSRRVQASREIETVLGALGGYAERTHGVKLLPNECTAALLVFAAQFSVQCVQTYLQGTALPELPKASQRDLFLVHSFVKNASEHDVDLFEHIMVVVKGHMLSNALLCPDLESTERKLGNLLLFFDTPLILDLLGLHGEEHLESTMEILLLVQRLGAKVVIFEHTLQEVNTVLWTAETNPKGVGKLERVVLRNQLTPSDIALVRGQLRSNLDKLHISSWPVPSFSVGFAIDASVLDKALDDEIGYYNPQAKEYDARSIEYIYRFRRGKLPLRLEDSIAILVTSNSELSRVAYKYGKEHESSREVSSVITAYSLANTAWLKAPLGAPGLPAKEVISVCYAALEPGRDMWSKYLAEINKLQARGSISPDEHRVLRDSLLSREELMNLTLGSDIALTQETVPQVLSRVKKALMEQKDAELEQVRTELDKTQAKSDAEIRAERAAHEQTRQRLADTQAQQEKQQAELYWKALRLARVLSWCGWAFVTLVLASAAILLSPWASRMTFGHRWLVAFSSFLLIVGFIWGFLNWLFGITVKRVRELLEKFLHARIATWLVGRQGDAN